MAQVTKRGNSYSIRCYCGTDVNGKRIIKNFTWKPDDDMTPRQIEKELERQVFMYEERCLKGIVLDTNMTFGKYINDVWLPRVENNIKPTTFMRYKGMLGRIIPALGHFKIGQLQLFHLYTFYDNLRETKREDVKCTPNDEAKKLMKTETRPELSNHIGISMTTIDVIRAGKRIGIETAVKVADYFKVKPEKVFEMTGENLSDRTVLHHHRLISTIMQSAVYDEVIASNLCKRTQAPRVERKEARYLDDVQAEKLLDLIA